MRLFLAGHLGMVGAALLRQLQQRPDLTLLLRDRAALDLTDRGAVRAFFAEARPEAVILAAARVGGIGANAAAPADFLAQNLAIALNVIEAAHEAGVQRLLNLGSSCIYPRQAAQPIAEEALLTGPLEPTNEGYAIAKIAALRLCDAHARQHGRDYRSVMPCNLYGSGDDFDSETAHVLPALIARVQAAKEAGAASLSLWGTGTPRREFLHVDDLAEAALLAMELPHPAWRAALGPDLNHLNIGSGSDIAIRDLAALVAEVTGYEGAITLDPSRPDGTPRKLMDVSRLAALGWRPRIGLRAGIARTHAWYMAQRESAPDLA
ncbi:GDP-L-fucose synthase family protein [Pseudoroseicyclus aestuarii]|uniref:GDP-L-fucose synthase n=1 Tax=Pseudoroseicyclus aestuarii TaxID=1795041 RepID=A0A318SST2_9RHOB|nr:GDP-L-fucose synthase [Pseudoroseicyclus aestuarii]PYE82199.1 GDP-L-fucose synthase [Pseudoroseicyclus aestuarii]